MEHDSSRSELCLGAVVIAKVTAHEFRVSGKYKDNYIAMAAPTLCGPWPADGRIGPCSYCSRWSVMGSIRVGGGSKNYCYVGEILHPSPGRPGVMASWGIPVANLVKARPCPCSHWCSYPPLGHLMSNHET